MTPRAATRAILIGLAFALLLPAAAAAQLVLTLRQGKAWVESSDLELRRPGGTDLALRDVTWEDQSYRSPIYYGVGLTWWLPRHREWGLGVDLTHAKAILETGETAFAQGRLAGVPVAAPVPVDSIVPALQFSHGLNLATLSGYRRWWTAPRGEQATGVALYLGLGAGVAVPHVEARVGGVRTDEYQLAGPAARGVVGLDVPYDEHVSLVGEATLSWADVRADLADGGSVRTRLLVPQLSLGLALRD
jgi:lipid A oxidase